LDRFQIARRVGGASLIGYGKPYGEPVMEELSNRKILLTRMDNAFSDYSHEAEKLSVLLAGPRDRFSWTSYHNLLRQRVAEVVAYEKCRNIQG
jgi:hypothetical protein